MWWEVGGNRVNYSTKITFMLIPLHQYMASLVSANLFPHHFSIKSNAKYIKRTQKQTQHTAHPHTHSSRLQNSLPCVCTINNVYENQEFTITPLAASQWRIHRWRGWRMWWGSCWQSQCAAQTQLHYPVEWIWERLHVPINNSNTIMKGTDTEEAKICRSLSAHFTWPCVSWQKSRFNAWKIPGRQQWRCTISLKCNESVFD